MANRDSPLFYFIKEALKNNKYPFVLYWTDVNEGIFCLKCVCKYKKEWTPLHSKIFDDYHNLKPRKSNDKRQRLLVALNKCPLIVPLKDKSTKEEKLYKFSTHGTPSDDTSMEDNVCDLQIGNDLVNCLSPLLVDSSTSILDDLELGEKAESDIDELLKSSAMDVADPNVDLEYLESGASASFYHDSDDLMNPAFSGQAPESSDPSNHLQGEELSYSFEIKAGNDDVLPDYDPVEDFFQSIRTLTSAEMETIDPSTIPKADPNHLGNVQTMPGTPRASSKRPSIRVFKLDDDDDLVKKFRRDNQNKKLFMMVLNPENI